MVTLKLIWDEHHGNYVTEGIHQRWRKADIFPEIWNSDINSEVGSASGLQKDKVVSKEFSGQLMAGVKLKAN